MKTRKLISVISCFIFIFILFALSSNASAENEGDWCSGVKVLGAGASTQSKVILVQHSRTDCGAEWPANTPRWFVLDDSYSNASAMLAAALTAQTTGKFLILVGKNKLFNEWNVLEYVVAN